MQLNFIANVRVPSSSGRSLPVVDPSDGQAFDEIQRSNAHDVDDAVAAARDGFDGVWSKVGAAERGQLLLRLSQEVATHAEELGAILQRTTGRPMRQAASNVAALTSGLAACAAACDKLQTEAVPERAGYAVSAWREPRGVTGHLIPWYAPLRIFARDVGAALAAGNVCVVRPADENSLVLLRVAELAALVGFPAGALNIVTGQDQEIGEALARHAGVAHISLSGSARLATVVQQAAVERGCPVAIARVGKSPQIVFADADLDTAVPAILRTVIRGAGLGTSAGTRLLVEQAGFEALLDRLANAFEALRVGPAALDLDMGPLISQEQQQRVWDFLSDAQAAGVHMVTQGVVVDEAPQTGFYQAPTLLRDLPPARMSALEDVPGPVLAAIAFDSEAQAAELANQASQPSTTSLWTRDAERPRRLARTLRCARVTVNDHDDHTDMVFPFDPGASALDAVLAFTTLKTLAIRNS